MHSKVRRQAITLKAVAPDVAIPPSHSIRRIKPAVDRALVQLSPIVDQMYADNSPASIPPQHLRTYRLPMACHTKHQTTPEIGKDRPTVPDGSVG